jgi:hypothetical protein
MNSFSAMLYTRRVIGDETLSSTSAFTSGDGGHLIIRAAHRNFVSPERSLLFAPHRFT